VLKPPQVQRIETLDLPELQPYRTMRRQLEHRQQGIFVAEGEKVVRRLLESNLDVVSLLLPEKWLRDLMPLLDRRREGLRIYVADKKLLEALTGFSMYQGLLAVGKVPPHPSMEEMLQRSAKPRLFVAIDSLSSAENVGAVVRNCAAFSVQALITGETSTSPFLRRAVRSSMGAIFHLPVVESSSLVDTLALLRDHDVRCIAAHPHVSGRTVTQTELKSDCCLVFGSEGYGLSPATLAACNEAAAVPMPQTVDSLNVASAAAVFLYEVTRQRVVSRAK
jgi:tRNA G18 (ribose-2'-O)-methylase SpoU